MDKSLKKATFTVVKIAVPTAIIIWLAVDIYRNDPDTFSRLQNQPKNWGLLGLAGLTCFAAISFSFLRWYHLVRALHIPFRVRDAFRLGFVGFLFNFVSLGSVGGDFFKGLLVAHEQRGRRLEAVATIVVDRIVGLYGLLLVTSGAILMIDLPDPSAEIQFLATVTLLLTFLGGLVMVLMLLTGKTWRKIVTSLSRIPRLGPPIHRLAIAFSMYRSEKPRLAVAGIMSLAVHISLTVAIYLAARGLYSAVPTLLQHFIICPMAGVVGALPISPSGLGTYEFAMRYLYDHVPPSDVGHGKGLVVALCYRVMQIMIAMVGVVFYWLNRREVTEVLEEAEQSNGEVLQEEIVR